MKEDSSKVPQSPEQIADHLRVTYVPTYLLATAIGLLLAAFIVWDKVFMHFVIPCYDPAFGESGASALLVLETLKKAREKHLRFEFGDPDDRITLKEHKLFNPKPFKYFSVEKSYKGFMAFIIRCAERFT